MKTFKERPTDDELEKLSKEIFPPGACPYCGRSGQHPQCETKAIELDRRYRETDEEHLRKYSVHGLYGVVGPDSEQSFARAFQLLERHLRRLPTFDRASAIEGGEWWFLPEGWIGMIGFIVEKRTDRIFALGSGLGSWRPQADSYAHWCAIHAYLSGHVLPEPSVEA
jgi:hypothetical protein